MKKERKKRIEEIHEMIMTENSPKVMTDFKPQIRETQ